MKRRILGLAGVLAALGFAILLLSYEIVGVDFADLMEDQPAIGYQDGPRLLAPEESIPLSRPPYDLESGFPVNPVPPDAVSQERGAQLFDQHCAVCHGTSGQDDGPVVRFWKEEARRPADLTEARIDQFPDGYIYQVIHNGIGAMPPLRENLNERERWDVINHVKTLQP